MKLERFKENPIISPSKNWWEVQATFNPAAAIYQDKILLLYRALGGDSLSRFGLAESVDGREFKRFSNLVFEGDTKNEFERLGVEDPRITLIEQTYCIVYTAASVYPAEKYIKGNYAVSANHPAPWRIRPSLLTTKDFQTFDRKGILLDSDTKDACLFPEKINGKYALLHRIYPNMYLTYSEDLKNWAENQAILSPRANFWDSERVGGGSAPIKTEQGWLIFYHGVDHELVYRLGVLVLDLADPSKLVYRSAEAVLEPEEEYEKIGLTKNVVFTCGAVESKDKFLVYYGAADKVIGGAQISKEKLLNEIRKQ